MDFRVDKGWEYEYKELPIIKSDDDVEEYVKIAYDYFPKWTRGVYKRIEVPSFTNPLAQENWEFEQIRRCVEGHDGLPGRMYFYFHFCWIQNISGGFIRPQFRVSDIIWFHLIESCEFGNYNQGWGVICVKRRRGGFSWKQACDSLWESLFKEGSQIAMISKDEEAAEDLLKKVHTMDSKLPLFLKLTKIGKAKDYVEYGRKEKNEFGQEVISGNQSRITVKAPSDTALESLQAGKLVIDEVGKIPNIDTIWSMGEPILMEEMERVGVPIMFGTAGEQTKAGVGQKNFWVNNDSYNFKRFFYPGWAGLSSDEFGNDEIEKAVRYILAERKKRFDRGDEKKYIEYIQQYPLHISEAFLSNNQTGVGHRKNINNQINVLDSEKEDGIIGKFEKDINGTVIFTPNSIYDSSGFGILRERPKTELSYTGGCDPADHDFVQEGSSDLSLYILSKQKGSRPPQIVFSMTYRTEIVDDWYEQAALALTYFRSRVLIENNRNGMIKYFENNGYFHLLRHEPLKKSSTSRKQKRAIGVRASTASKIELERCINQYTTNYCDLILDKDLLLEFIAYKSENTDRVMAFGWALVAIDDEYITEETISSIKKALPKTRMTRKNGILTRTKQ